MILMPCPLTWRSASRPDAQFHEPAHKLVTELAAGTEHWAIPWPCAHEFVAFVTHPRIYRKPTPVPIALQALRALEALPVLEFIGEGDSYLDALEAAATPARIQGGATHDARIAAICRYHGVRELWSADRDFSRFGQLAVRNPLLS